MLTFCNAKLQRIFVGHLLYRFKYLSEICLALI